MSEQQLDVREQQMQAFAQEVIALAAGKYRMHWLDIVFMFGIMSRGLANSEPTARNGDKDALARVEQEAAEAYAAGLAQNVALKPVPNAPMTYQ